MSASPPDPPLEHQLRELAAVHQSLRVLTSTLELPEILRAVLGGIKAFTSAEGLSLLLYDPERDELVFAATETLQESTLLGPAATGGRWAARTGESVLLEEGRVLAVPLRRGERVLGALELRTHYDGRPFTEADRERLERAAAELGAEVSPEALTHDAAALHRLFARVAGVVERTGLVPRSMLCVPVVKKNALLGVIQVINRLDGSCFTEDELRLVETLAGHAAIAIENASLYREAQLAAITDDLTGLGNTRHFNRMLPELVGRGRPVSLLMLDLDNFKAIVDTYG